MRSITSITSITLKHYGNIFTLLEFTPKNYAKGKDRLLIFVNGHCKTVGGYRETYIRALSKLIKIDVHGKCAGIFGRFSCRRGSKECESLIKRYKFYISFENSVCNDYVSEKYWNVPFDHDIIPIVFGLKFLKELAIPGSYIDATKFKDLHSLVSYLKYLDKNDTAYNEYFKWKQFYQTSNVEPWPCRLCRMLHNTSLPVKSYTHFDRFLDPKLVCSVWNKDGIRV